MNSLRETNVAILLAVGNAELAATEPGPVNRVRLGVNWPITRPVDMVVRGGISAVMWDRMWVRR